MQTHHQNARSGVVFVPMAMLVEREGEREERLSEAYRPFKRHMTNEGPKPIELYFAKVTYGPP